MKRIISLVVVGLLVLGMATVAFGYGRAGTRGGMMSQDEGHMMSQGDYNNDYLDLSDEQLAEMRALEDEYYQQTRELNDQLRRKRDDLRYLYSQSDTSQNELAQLQTEINQIRGALSSLRNEYDLAVRDILPTEQLERTSRTGMSNGFDHHRTNNRSANQGRSRGHGMMSVR
ncbi:periplasmic heavy metal sensor [Natroniella sulfidigena]|uniref:Spy/CpxP family protein refolding chaperone n=1 Tax=Natroniella sulfidigena TaxID=723921 RepID=UPI00200B70D3|nr:periplasmic heavy metal sensor [Natroniella sulfidigena]MCK8816765.1 periplasmic heavy metal sensor [Natroniella sulfidigena]